MSLLFFKFQNDFLFRDVVTGPLGGFQNHDYFRSKSAYGLIRLCLFRKSHNKVSCFFYSPDVRFDYVVRKMHWKCVS